MADISIEIVVDRYDRRRLIASALAYNKANLGRALRRDLAFPGCPNLFKGDRLEATESFTNVAELEVARLPIALKFGRMNASGRVLHHSPLLEIEGADLHAIDALHTWHLGPLSVYVCFVIWFRSDLRYCHLILLFSKTTSSVR